MHFVKVFLFWGFTLTILINLTITCLSLFTDQKRRLLHLTVDEHGLSKKQIVVVSSVRNVLALYDLL